MSGGHWVHWVQQTVTCITVSLNEKKPSFLHLNVQDLFFKNDKGLKTKTVFESLSLVRSFSEDEVLMIGLLLCLSSVYQTQLTCDARTESGQIALISKTSFLFLSKMIRSLSAFINPVLNSILGNVGHQWSRSREGERVSFKTSSHMNLWNAGKHSRLMSSVTVPEGDLFLKQQ